MNGFKEILVCYLNAEDILEMTINFFRVGGKLYITLI